MHVCMYIRMYVYMYVRMYVCMYVCMYTCMHVYVYVCMCTINLQAFLHVCAFVLVCIHVWYLFVRYSIGCKTRWIARHVDTVEPHR